jgi:hypothetical protein
VSRALTGGFDTCLELASSFVDLEAEPAVASSLQPLQGLQLTLVSAPGGPVIAGTVRLLLTRADVLAAGDFDDGRVSLRLRATLGTTFTAPAPDRLALAAVVSLPALSLVMVPPARHDGQTQSSFAVDLTAFQVHVEPDHSSATELAAVAGRLGVPAASVIGTLTETLQASLAGFLTTTSPGSRLFPVGGPSLRFARPGQDGRLGQSTDMTLLTGVALTTRAAAGAHPGVLCVLGNLFDGPTPIGQVQDKTAVATTTGAGALIVSAPAAERFVLCPSVFRALLPTYLNQVLDSHVLAGVRPEDVPGYSTSDPGYQHDIRKALHDSDVGFLFDLILPGGLPPISYRDAIGPALFGRLRTGIQVFLSDTDAGMATILPSQCGSNDAMPMPESRLAAIHTHLIQDHITISGVIEPTRWGIGGRIRFSATLYPTVEFGGRITLTASPPEIDSTIHLEWYAVVIGAFVGAILAGLTAITGGAAAVGEAALVGAVAGTVVSLTMVQTVLAAFAVNAVTNELTQTLQTIAAADLPLPTGTVATAITVAPDGMTLQFGLALDAPTTPPPLTAPIPSLSLGVEITADRKPGAAGTVQIDNRCVKGSFAYQDYIITTFASFAVHPVNLAAPVTYTWTLDGIGLDQPYGTLTANDPAYTMLYSFNTDKTALTVLNQPGSSTYNRLVDCVATGADGITAHAARGVQFVGAQRVLEPAYGAQLAKCLQALVHTLGKPVQGPPSTSGIVTHQDLITLIQRLTPGGEWDPRASGLLQAALQLGAVTAPDVTHALAAAIQTKIGN